jgi:hypothetical protein
VASLVARPCFQTRHVQRYIRRTRGRKRRRRIVPAVRLLGDPYGTRTRVFAVRVSPFGSFIRTWTSSHTCKARASAGTISASSERVHVWIVGMFLG